MLAGLARLGMALLLITLSTAPAWAAGTAPAANPAPDQKELLRLTGLVRQAGLPDPKIKIAQLLHQVRLGLPPDTFYKKLSEMDLPMEARFQLMEVKKDLGNILGDQGLRFFLGQPTAAGGSAVETRLLSWRRQMVMDGIRQVIQEFKGKNRVDGHEFRVYYAEIGGWATETPDQMRFEGDIDFSFVCGNRALAWQMKLAFDSYVKSRIGLTGQQADTVCTAHGMAEPEVYVGRHGEIFAERAMSAEKAKKLQVVDLDSGALAGEIEGAKVLENIVMDAKSLGQVPELPLHQAPTEPGISMEMIRHFLHDIMHNPVYTDIDSFLKAAKYTSRSNEALSKAFGLASNDPQLAAFVERMLELKKAGSAAQVDAIRDFFGGRLPWGVELGPSQGGRSRVTLVANTAVLDSFWARCRDSMWKNAEAGFQKVLGDLRTKAKGVADAGEAAKLKAEMDAVLKMMEIEFLLFDDPKVGAKVPASVRGMMTDLRALYKGFMEDWGLRTLTPEEMKEYRFLEALLKQGGDWNIKTAMVALVQAGGRSVMRVNSYLDILDDRTLGVLRGETGEWRQYLEDSRRKVILEEWHRQGRRGPPPPGLRLEGVDPGSMVSRIETWMNTTLHNNCLVRKIRGVNMVLGESIQSSAAGRAAMTGMIAVNLAQEIPAYITAFNEQGWQALATEFFRRRVPFGSVTEHAIMGRYGLAAWDTLVVFVPPLALFQVAGMIGAGVAEQSWKIFWTSELEYFVDELYEEAEFVLKDTERVSDDLVIPKWRLAKIRYRDQEVVVEEFKEAKQEQIRAMIQALETPHREREFPIEYRYEGLTGLFEVDDILRINLEETDNFLFMLREMMKHESVGQELKDHYMDQWTTHWEQVKLNFILRTIAILEERRKTEQLRQSGKMEEVVKELNEAARKLKIEKEVEEGLEEELGQEIFRYFKYLKDLMVGLKREFYGQPDVWDEYEEGSRILVHYLETYLKIIEARDQAEKEFALGLPRDRGLRLITGPYFLKGRADQDKSGHLRWRDLPWVTKAEVTSELEGIKAKYVSPSTLEEGYDRRFLEIVARHDVWRDAWRHANSQGLESHPEAWAEIQSYFSDEELKADSNPALARFKFHKERRDRLIEEFEEYYRNKAQDEPRPPTPACREELEKARGLAAELEDISVVLGQALSEAIRLGRALDGLPGAASSLESLGQRAQGLADQAEQEGREAEGLARRVCELAGKLEASPAPAEAEAWKQEMETARERLKVLDQETLNKRESLERAARKAEQEFRSREKLAQEVTSAQAELARLAQELARIRGELESLPVLPEEETPPQDSQTQEGQAQASAPGNQEQDPAQPLDCAQQYRNLKQSLKNFLDEREGRLDKAARELAEKLAATPLEELLDRLSRAAEAVKVQAERAAQAAQAAAKALEQGQKCQARADQAGQGQGARQLIGDCRFKEAATIIQGLPEGAERKSLEASLEGARKSTELMREAYRKAQAAFRTCDFQEAQARIKEALGLSVCDRHGQRLEAALTKVQAAVQREARAQQSLDQAQAEFEACRLEAAQAALEQAREQTRCPGLQGRIEALRTRMAQAGRDLARVPGLVAQGRGLLAECRFKEALKSLEEAAGIARCGLDKARVEAAVAEARTALAKARQANELYKKGLAQLRSCDLEAARGSGQAALDRADCAEHRARINKLLAQIESTGRDEAEARSLLDQASGLSGPDRPARAREMLLRAQAKARCPGTKSRVGSGLAGLGDAPPPPGPGPGEGEPFFVTLELHLPWPKEMPEMKKAPDGADKQTRERIKEENKRRMQEFIRNLTLSKCTIMSLSSMKSPPLLMVVRGEGLKAYPREMFAPGAKLGMPFKVRYKEKDEYKNMDSVFLVKAKALFQTLEQALAAEPELAKQIEKQRAEGRSTTLSSGLPFETEDGIARFNEEKGSGTMGPLVQGWSGALQQRALELTKTFLGVFTSLDFLGDCFVATAVYGDPGAPELIPLRRFRDRILESSPAGHRLVRFYYRHGPSWAAWIRERPWAARPIRTLLGRISARLDRTDWEALAREGWLKALIGLGGWLVGEPAPEEPRAEGFLQSQGLTAYWQGLPRPERSR